MGGEADAVGLNGQGSDLGTNGRGLEMEVDGGGAALEPGLMVPWMLKVLGALAMVPDVDRVVI